MHQQWLKSDGQTGKPKRRCDIAKSWVRLPITGGATVIDLEQLPTFDLYRWHVNSGGYAAWRGIVEGCKKTIRLHRLIAKTPDHLVTDHINHDRLDNRSVNLRACTSRSNSQNVVGRRGYCWDQSKKKWLVRYRDQFYGRYLTEAEAKVAIKLARSGVEYAKRARRRNYFLPKGVTKNKYTGGYQAKTVINGVKYYLGTFATIEDAQRAYYNINQEKRNVRHDSRGVESTENKQGAVW